MDEELAATLGRRRGPRWTRVGHGVHRPSRDVGGPHDDLLAWRLVLPSTGMFTHLTAAREYGWWLPPVPTDLPVFASVPLHESRPQRAGLRVSRLVSCVEPVIRDGVPLAPPAEVLLACARDLGLLDLVVLCDAALHLGSCTPDDIAAVSRDRRRGAPLLRHALRLADPRAESAWETMIRMLHVACDVPVVPQYEVYDDGVLLARGDLLILGTRTLHEYDGEHHLARSRQRRDLARARDLGHAGYTRRGYTSYEVLNQAIAVLRDADASLGRPHLAERIRVWHGLLTTSLFTPVGTHLLRSRWGLTDPPPATGEVRQASGRPTARNW